MANESFKHRHGQGIVCLNMNSFINTLKQKVDEAQQWMQKFQTDF